MALQQFGADFGGVTDPEQEEIGGAGHAFQAQIAGGVRQIVFAGADDGAAPRHLPGVGQGGDAGGLHRGVDAPTVLKSRNPRDDLFRGQQIAQPQAGKGVIFGH